MTESLIARAEALLANHYYTTLLDMVPEFIAQALKGSSL